MDIKYTILSLLCGIASAIQAFTGYMAIRADTDKNIVTACQYLWGYDLVSAVCATGQGIYCLSALACAIFTTTAHKRRTVMLYLAYLFVLMGWGTLIKLEIDQDCSSTYDERYPEIWKYFHWTFWWAVGVWCVYVVFCLVYCLYNCCKETDTMNEKFLREARGPRRPTRRDTQTQTPSNSSDDVV